MIVVITIMISITPPANRGLWILSKLAHPPRWLLKFLTRVEAHCPGEQYVIPPWFCGCFGESSSFHPLHITDCHQHRWRSFLQCSDPPRQAGSLILSCMRSPGSQPVAETPLLHPLIYCFFFIGISLIYNVVLVSGVQQSESVSHNPLFFRFFSHLGHHRVLSTAPCAI